MSKKIFKVCYFKHDFNARSDSKISRLLMSLGWEGYGLYWAIVEKLYEAGGRIANDADALAFDLRTTPDALSKIISDFGLFFVVDGMIASKSVDRRIVEMSGKSKQSKLAAEERWRIAREKREQSERIANAMPEEKSRVKKSREEKITKPSRPPTEVQLIVEAYKQIKLIPKDDKAWDKDNFARCAKAAKVLMASAGSIENAISYLNARGSYLSGKGLEWALETIAKNCADKAPVQDQKHLAQTNDPYAGWQRTK